MVLEWRADRHDDAACACAAHRIRSAIDDAFETRSVLPIELGGSDTTEAVTAAVNRAIDEAK
jgi:hypothetical protein